MLGSVRGERGRGGGRGAGLWARVIAGEAERRALLVHVARAWSCDELEVMVRCSPLIEVLPDDPASA